MLKLNNIKQNLVLALILIVLIRCFLANVAFAQDLGLTIDSIEGYQDTITVNYTVTSSNGGLVTTLDHAFSTDGGTTLEVVIVRCFQQWKSTIQLLIPGQPKLLCLLLEAT